MKKIFLLPMIFVMTIFMGCTEEEIANMSEEDLQDTYEAVADMFEEFEARQVRGSCNAIDKGSVCVDYIGSYWENSDFAELNCTGDGQVYSENACPYPENGGCQMSAGTTFEMIAWMYPYGGDPFTGDVLTSAVMVCNATLGSQWTMPEF